MHFICYAISGKPIREITSMRYLLYTLLALTVIVPSFAEDAASPDRDALLKAAVARDRGSITALEALGDAGQSVVVGYASGAVLVCQGESSCTELGGTPNTAVEHLAVSGNGAAAVVWASYPQGALYRCSKVNCRKFLWDTSSER